MAWPMDDPRELRAKAAHYRELERYITDAQAHSGIIGVAEQYEAMAAELEQPAEDDSP